MGIKNPRRYTSEFKQQAGQLALKIGLSRAAEQLGVNVSTMHRWKSVAQKQEPQSKIEKIGLEEENRQLRKEVEELKKVNQILKRAAAFFSQDHLK